MKQITSDTVYNDLKERGLYLSIPSTLIIPNSPQPVPTLLSKLGAMLTKQKPKPVQDKIIPFPILNSAIVVGRKYTAFVYKYKTDQETSQLHIQHKQVIQLQYPVQKISSCNLKFSRDKGEVPVSFLTHYGFNYFIYDLKREELIEKTMIKQSKIIAIEWLTDKQCMIVTSDGIISNYTVSQGVFQTKNTLKVSFNINGDQILRKAWIIADIDEEQLSTVSLFYTVTAPGSVEDNPKMFVYVKQLVRNLSGQIEIEEKPDYLVETNNLYYSNQFFINGVGDYYCMQLSRQILVLKKKYDKYMILDNMGQKNDSNCIFLNSLGVVLSVGKGEMELNSIHFADPKCNLRICDIVDIPENLSSFRNSFYSVWPIIIQKKFSLIFVLLQEDRIILSHLVKVDAMTKMMQKAQEAKDYTEEDSDRFDQKKLKKQKLDIVRDLALNLGIPNKNFYLQLWTKSNKENTDIYEYLMPCVDVPSIKKQLISTLRRRTIPVSQIMKILENISEIISEDLSHNLTQLNIKLYVKNDFLRRKFKMDEANKLLDHRIFNKIYFSSLQNLFEDIVKREIDPVEIKMDPLHAMVDQTPIQQLKTLQMVFQEFKLILLEDYQIFLIDFLKKFPNKLLEILQRFSFLLPMYPFTINVQKPSKTNEPVVISKSRKQIQPLWFQEISVTQWQNQMTKQRIIKEFYDHYPTSRIKEAVDDFINSMYGKENKRWKHGLITLSLQQYTEKVKTLQGIRLYLQVCQHANLKQIFSPNGDPSISDKILNILQKKNGLTGDDLKYCRIYSSMQYFMLKNNIIEKQKIDIMALTELTPEDLVALFFLENKQKQQYIFEDFMNLYENKNQFIAILESFVKSENCSKIELDILIKDIAQKGRNFQENNQQIIDLLISGLCMKFLILEDLPILETEHSQSCLIDKISLSQKLALKVNRIKQLTHCRTIFLNFRCDAMTYNQVLNLEQDNTIFKLLLQKFFNNQYNEEQIDIEAQFQPSDIPQKQQENIIQKIKIESPLSMLWVLLWLQQRVYYNISKQDFIQTYAQVLLQWKQFEVIKIIIYEVSRNGKTILQELEIDSEQFKNQLILRALDMIYRDEEILYDQETKEQIISILNIDRDNTGLKIRQLAKLQLVDIFQKWGQMVHTFDIHRIFCEWLEGNKRQFVDILLDKHITKLDFKGFTEIYTELQIASQEITDVDIYNRQFGQFSILFAFKLLEKGKYKEIPAVLSFIKQIGTIPISFGLQSETFLKNITEIFKDDIDQGKKMIEFFCQNNTVQQNYNIKKLYDSGFNPEILDFWMRQQSVTVDAKSLYSRAPYTCQYKLQQLWGMVQNQVKSPQQQYYCYYFLIMAIKKPQLGLKKLHKISYNLTHLTDLLLGLEDYNSSRKQFFLIDFSYLIRKFEQGLVAQAISRLDIGNGIQLEGTNQEQAILGLLKQSKETHPELLKCTNRIFQERKSKFKRGQRKKRFESLMNQIAKQTEQRLKREQQQRQIEERNQQKQVVEQIGVFLNWKQISEKKKTITQSQSHIFDSEKELIDHIFQNYQMSPLKKKFEKGVSKPSVLSNLFMPSLKQTQKLGTLIEFLKNQQYQKAAKFQNQLIIQALKTVLTETEDIDLLNIMDLMDQKDIGDKQKRQRFKLSKYFRGNISNSTLNTIFDLDFFLNPLNATEDEKYAKLYSQLKPKILVATKKLSPELLKDVAHMFGHILESSQYSSLVYYDTLLDFAINANTFDSNTAFMAQQCVAGLGQYTDIIVTRYQEILDAFVNEKQLKLFVRENLSKIMQEKGHRQIAKAIKTY